MEVGSLYDMVTYLQRGTRLHIGVLFFGNYGNQLCELPHKQQIHSGIVCEEFKTRGKHGYRRCFACRNLALKKALEGKVSFGGCCINGVYEYTHPVVLSGEVACVIFIGNILDEKEKITHNIGEKLHLLDTMEQGFKQQDCQVIARLLEGYIRMLLEKGADKQADTNPLIENIKNYIQSNLEFDIDITRIAEFFHYNKVYLGRLFKKETNLSVKEYINIQRMERAKDLLATTGDAVIDIAGKVGFNNVTYFNRMFRSTFGMAPTRYRAIIKEEKR